MLAKDPLCISLLINRAIFKVRLYERMEEVMVANENTPS